MPGLRILVSQNLKGISDARATHSGQPELEGISDARATNSGQPELEEDKHVWDGDTYFSMSGMVTLTLACLGWWHSL